MIETCKAPRDPRNSIPAEVSAQDNEEQLPLSQDLKSPFTKETNKHRYSHLLPI